MTQRQAQMDYLLRKAICGNRWRTYGGATSANGREDAKRRQLQPPGNFSKGTTGDDVEQVIRCVEDTRLLANKIIGRVEEPPIQQSSYEGHQQKHRDAT